MNLVIHIGLPKTGTTTIQDYLTCNAPEGYLGKFSGIRSIDQESIKEKARLLSMFRYASPVAPNRGINYDWLNLWVEQVKKLYSGKGCDNLIISDERLSSRGGRVCNRWPVGNIANDYDEGEDRPFVEFVKVVREHWTEGEVKVLLSIRNQPTWLASLYAQRSYRITRASQKNFERVVANVITRRGDFLEWNVLIQELQNVLEDGKLKVVLMEDMNNNYFWDGLAEFLGINEIEYNPMDIQRCNVNSLGDLKWKIKNRRVPTIFHCEDLLNNALTGLGVREKSFCLSGSILHIIRDRYRLPNLDLAEMLERNDLHDLGYL